MATIPTDPAETLAALEASDRFLIQQVFRPVANEYRISVPAPGSTDEGAPLLFVKQKRMKIKEDIRFRVAADEERHLFMIKARTVFEFRGRHDVFDEQGAKIGALEKAFGKSLFRSHWIVRDELGEQVFEAHEASWPIALLRRFADLLPFDLLGLLTWLPFNFVLVREGQKVATYTRVLGKLRDRYVLELGPELAGVDKRLVLAFAVALDALQDR
ncbi:MAG TPA: hypothetical protein VK896_08270 [Gaiellaceae bacterium]|nr:hypothetical protein [Gaiellaceae bacterium]HSJ94017.1 hypothetical protein [Gaiellaceae bacterium]